MMKHVQNNLNIYKKSPNIKGIHFVEGWRAEWRRVYEPSEMLVLKAVMEKSQRYRQRIRIISCNSRKYLILAGVFGAQQVSEYRYPI
jgi:hypothetical protein